MLEDVRAVLKDSLQLAERAATLHADSGLLGELPELDSMAVVTIITALEDRYGFMVDDDEISAETFETMGSLARFLESKVNA